MRALIAVVPLLSLTIAACGEPAGEDNEHTGPNPTETAVSATTPPAAAPDSAGATLTVTPTTATSTPTVTTSPTATSTPTAQPKTSAGLTQQQASRIAHERHERFEEMGDAFKAITDEIRRASPDLAKIQAGAATINRLAPQVRTWFPVGSAPQAGVKTDALATVWTKPAEFRQAADRLVEQAGRFHATAQAGDPPAIRSASRTLGAACKNCHDQFREEDD